MIDAFVVRVPSRFRGGERAASRIGKTGSSTLSAPATVPWIAEDLTGERFAPAAAELVDGFSPEAAQLVLGLARENANLSYSFLADMAFVLAQRSSSSLESPPVFNGGRTMHATTTGLQSKAAPCGRIIGAGA